MSISYEDKYKPITSRLDKLIDLFSNEPIQNKSNSEESGIERNIRNGVYSDWARNDFNAYTGYTLKKHSEELSECKSKVKPREFWIEEWKTPKGFKEEPELLHCVRLECDPNIHSQIHVTEVPKGYKLVNEQQVLDALCEYNEDNPRFLKALGFDE